MSDRIFDKLLPPRTIRKVNELARESESEAESKIARANDNAITHTRGTHIFSSDTEIRIQRESI